ncbi:MAG: GNAT family N-acetyltransferase [bacterium]|nr:GNAT family N-acetyltransferase [bacterium]
MAKPYFRRITVEDAGRLAALRNADDTWEWFFSKRRFTEGETARWIAGLDPEREEVYIAEGEGGIVGTCSLYRIDRSERRAEVGRIIVAVPFRRRGTGEVMLREMFGRGRSLGLDLLYANIMPENEASRRLFSKCGFREVGPGAEGGLRYECRLAGG